MSKLNIADAVAVLQAVAPSLAAGNVFALHSFDDPFVDSLIDEMGVQILATELTSGQVLSGPLSPDQAATIEVVQGMTDTIALIAIEAESNEEAPATTYHMAGFGTADRDALDKAGAIIAEELGVPAFAVRVESNDDGQSCNISFATSQIADRFGRLVSETVFPETVEPDPETVYNASCAYGIVGCDCLENPEYAGATVAPGVTAGEPSGVGSERAEILIDAAVTTTSDRNDQYGEPENSFPEIAALWTAHLGFDVSPHDVAVLMALMKIARTNAGYKRDSYVDAAGYLAIAGELALGEVTAPEGTVH